MKVSNYAILILRLFPAIMWMSLIYYMSSIPDLELTGKLSSYDLVLRKIAHMVEYAVLATLFWWGLQKPVTRKSFLSIFLLTLLYAISDEYHQSTVPTRDGKLVDVLIDSVGIVVAMGLIQYRYGRSNRNA